MVVLSTVKWLPDVTDRHIIVNDLPHIAIVHFIAGKGKSFTITLYVIYGYQLSTLKYWA